MGCAALVLDSRRRVLPRLDIGVRRRCRGLDRRGPIVTGGGKGKFQLDCSTYEVSGEMRVLNQRDFCHHHT